MNSTPLSLAASRQVKKKIRRMNQNQLVKENMNIEKYQNM